jgi:hypothetical protein
MIVIVKTEVLRKKPVPVPLWSLHFPVEWLGIESRPVHLTAGD